MKLILASLVATLAGGSAPSLPAKLPANIAGFEFGDSIPDLKTRCEKLGPNKHEGMPRFSLFKDHTFAWCVEVPIGKPYLPRVGSLYFHIRGEKLWAIDADLPLPTLLEHARAIGKREGAVVSGGLHCAPFADGVGAVCVDLEARRLSFQLATWPQSSSDERATSR
jgi:hypothetical protein